MPLLEKLREEVIEVQKAQAAIAHWKLLLIATFGAAGLGLFPSSGPTNHHILILGLLPFVCAYADAHSYNSGIRALSIARYFRLGVHGDYGSKSEDDAFARAREYERHAVKHRPRFDLEVVALWCTSMVVSCCVAVVGVLVLFWNDLYPVAEGGERVRCAAAAWLFASGVAGGWLADEMCYRHRCNVMLFDGRAERRPRRSVCALGADLMRTSRRNRCRSVK